jgi:hypothetical protein
MAFSRITRIILWVVAGISLVVILFFYIAPKTVDDYDAFVEQVNDQLAPVDLTPMGPMPVIDTTLTDSAAIAANIAAVKKAEDDRAAAELAAQNAPVKTVKDVTSGWEYLIYYRTDIALIWAYILVIITLIAALVFPLIAVIKNPKALVRLLLILAGTAVLVVIAYLLSNDTPIEIIGYTGTANTDPGTLKMIDTVLFITYMLFGLAIASILYAVISRAFK